MDIDIPSVFNRCFFPNDSYQFLIRSRVSANGKHELAQFFLYDTWDIELACKLITLGYPVQFEDILKELTRYPHDSGMYKFKRDQFDKMEYVYNRALGIAKSSVKARKIEEHDTQAKWIEWAKDKDYKVAHLMPADTSAAKVEAVPVATLAPATQVNKLRRDILDPAIDKAVHLAGSKELADVYLRLKELARDEEPPFTGLFDSDALCYTDTNDKPAKLTKNALGKRLSRR